MPKSTAKPMNRTKNASEIKFSAPTSALARAAVHTTPTTTVISAASDNRTLRKHKNAMMLTSVNEISSGVA